MAGELYVERLQAGAAGLPDQAVRVVAPQVTEPAVVAAVRAAQGR